MTSMQIGGSLGIAVLSTIATPARRRFRPLASAVAGLAAQAVVDGYHAAGFLGLAGTAVCLTAGARPDQGSVGAVRQSSATP